MNVPFVKMHGLGNDFVIVEDFDASLSLSPQTVARACDRHLGIGADGLIAVQHGSVEGSFYMHYFNADGSLAEMCGNGVRCFAKYLHDRRLIEGSELVAQTLGGPKRISVHTDDAGSFTAASVDMGTPVLTPADIPVDVDGDYAQDCPVDTSEGTFRFTGVSMGNPHAVVFVDDVAEAPVRTAGPLIETHRIFPNKTNVEFVQVVPGERLRVRVWERGVGETLACGTGACAAVVAATLRCAIGRRAVVELPGGELDITWQDDDHVLMTGPATEVFSGSIDL